MGHKFLADHEYMVPASGFDVLIRTVTARFARTGAVVVALSVVAPLLLLIVLTQTAAWPEPLPAGDNALTELGVWHALHDVQLTGICSHGCFRDPGPMLFYLLAPLYGLSGCARASFPASAGLINLAALLGILWLTCRLAGRGGLLWTALLLALYVRFLGIRWLVSWWTPHVQLLPLLLAVMLFAAVAAGRLWCLPWAVLVASLPAQTNVAYLPALGAIAVATLLVGWAFLPVIIRWASLPVIRSHRHDQHCSPESGRATPLRPLLVSLAVAVVIWALPVYRELTQPTSDLAQAVRYFAAFGPGHAWCESFLLLAGKLAEFPLFCIAGTRGVAWADQCPWLAGLVSGLVTLLLAVSSNVARRQGRPFDAALALLVLAMVAALPFSIHRIVGPVDFHATHWMSMVSLLALIVAGRAIANVLITRSMMSTVWAARLAILAVLACTLAATLRDAWLLPTCLRADEFDPDNGVAALADAALAALRADGAGDCRVRIVDHEAWTTAAELIVRLTKTGCRVSVDPEWELFCGPQHARRGPPQDVLLVCDAAAAARRPRDAPWKLVGRTPAATLFCRPATAVVEGRYEGRDMELFADELDGFFPAERSGAASFRWSGGDQSRLVLRLCRGQAYRLRLKVAPHLAAGRLQQLTVLLNDNRLATFDLPHAEAEEHVLTLPAALVLDHNTLVFRYAHALSPDSLRHDGDLRPLAIRWEGISFERFDQPPAKIAVGQAFQPDSERKNVRLESLTYGMLTSWRVVVSDESD